MGTRTGLHAYLHDLDSFSLLCFAHALAIPTGVDYSLKLACIRTDGFHNGLQHCRLAQNEVRKDSLLKANQPQSRFQYWYGADAGLVIQLCLRLKGQDHSLADQ